MKRISTIILLICIVCACENTSQNNQSSADPTKTEQMNTREFPEVVSKALEAHGGLEKWRDYDMLTFVMSKNTITNQLNEKHIIALQNRKVLIEHDSFRLGYDGQQVWVSPDKEAFPGSSARFYHNLYFYFFAFPFVIADDGTKLQPLGQKMLKGELYEAVRISYEEGVGDTPEDYYIAYFHPETFQMHWLLYTVTYFSGEAHENYNALHYPEWQEIDGLVVPKTMVGYKYVNDSVTDQERYRAAFTEVEFSTEEVDPNMFRMPETAEIDSLPKQL